jgi:hypothetical protein
MIQQFPPKVNAIINAELPATQKMWWVRGVVLNFAEIERATADPEKQNPGGRLRNMVVQIGDLDNPQDGYDVEIEGVSYQLEINDIVSLLGHEAKDADQASAPRLLINHNTGGLIKRCYPLAKSLNWGVLPMVERKYWLSVKTPANPAEKLKNIWILAGVLALPFLVIGWFGGFVALLMALLIMAFLLAPWVVLAYLVTRYLDWIVEQSPFSFETPVPRLVVQNYRAWVNFNRQDITLFYERLARALHAHAVENPDAEVEFVPVDRGSHTIGLLK